MPSTNSTSDDFDCDVVSDMTVNGSYGFTGGVGQIQANSPASGSVTVNSSGYIGHGVSTGANSYYVSYTTPAPQELMAHMTSSTSPKNGIMIVLCRPDDLCLELTDAQNMTPREMMGLHKFHLAVQAVLTHQSLGFNNKLFDWESFIAQEGIERFFTMGETPEFYKQNADAFSDNILILK